MFVFAKCIIFSTLIGGSYLMYAMKDDFPVLERLGCDECPRVYVPVCASDQKTYVNPCKLNCANSLRPKEYWAYMIRYGPCIELYESST